MLCNAEQKEIKLTRKTFLYDDDKLWASPSSTTDFNSFNLYFKRLGK